MPPESWFGLPVWPEALRPTSTRPPRLTGGSASHHPSTSLSGRRLCVPPPLALRPTSPRAARAPSLSRCQPHMRRLLLGLHLVPGSLLHPCAAPPASIIAENKRKLSRTNEERAASVAHALRRLQPAPRGIQFALLVFGLFVFVHHCRRLFPRFHCDLSQTLTFSCL